MVRVCVKMDGVVLDARSKPARTIAPIMDSARMINAFVGKDGVALIARRSGRLECLLTSFKKAKALTLHQLLLPLVVV